RMCGRHDRRSRRMCGRHDGRSRAVCGAGESRAGLLDRTRLRGGHGSRHRRFRGARRSRS
ncbi:hypothetical protein ACWC09_24870, partial [Streptomyces sp. NPDC001617]